jgi:hypothetical protein
MHFEAHSPWVIAGAVTLLLALGIVLGRGWRRSASKHTRRIRLSGGHVIATVGGVLVVAAIGGYGFNRDGTATIGFAVIGAALVVIGAMEGRLAAGTLKLGATGAEIPIGESQIQSGQVVSASVAVEASLGGHGSASGDVAVPDKAPESGEKGSGRPSEDAKAVMVPKDGPAVFLTQLANDALNSFHGSEREVVWNAVANLGKTAKDGTDKAIASTRAGVMYMERKVTPDVSLIYRQMDKTSEDDERYVILAIEKGQVRKRWWPDDIQFWP